MVKNYIKVISLFFIASNCIDMQGSAIGLDLIDQFKREKDLVREKREQGLSSAVAIIHAVQQGHSLSKVGFPVAQELMSVGANDIESRLFQINPSNTFVFGIGDFRKMKQALIAQDEEVLQKMFGTAQN